MASNPESEWGEKLFEGVYIMRRQGNGLKAAASMPPGIIANPQHDPVIIPILLKEARTMVARLKESNQLLREAIAGGDSDAALKEAIEENIHIIVEKEIEIKELVDRMGPHYEGAHVCTHECDGPTEAHYDVQADAEPAPQPYDGPRLEL
jgi:hypothetical protein